MKCYCFKSSNRILDYKNNFHFEQLSPNDYECSGLCPQNTYTGAFIRGEMSAQNEKKNTKKTQKKLLRFSYSKSLS